MAGYFHFAAQSEAGCRAAGLSIAPLLRDPAPALQANLGQADLERRK
jgi:hypothetical protein